MPTPVSSPQPSSHLASTGVPETSPIYNSANAPKAKKEPASKGTAKKEVFEQKNEHAAEASIINSGYEKGRNTEYAWLLGGILGGAVLGLLCVIIAKWKKSP